MDSSNGSAPPLSGEEAALALVERFSTQVNRARTALGMNRMLPGRSQPGDAFDGRRDYYRALGWIRNPNIKHYSEAYDSNPIAERVVAVPAEDTWRTPPHLRDGTGRDARDDTPFVAAFDRFAAMTGLWAALQDADTFAGIGRYGLLLLGFNDGKALDQPVTASAGLAVSYYWAFDERDVTPGNIITDTANPRYGLPENYLVDVNAVRDRAQQSLEGAGAGGKRLATPGESDQAVIVHPSRVLHIAEGPKRDRIFGRPRLRGLYNICQDIYFKVAGSGSEAVWRLVYRGLVAATKDGYVLPNRNTTEREQLEAIFDDFVNDLRRVMTLDGIEVTEVGGEMVDVTPHFEVLIGILALSTGIPKRTLLGSEVGELASSQDATNWAGRIETRRTKYAEPAILYPLIMHLVSVGILPPPVSGAFSFQWDSILKPDPLQLAQAAEALAAAIQHYTGGKGGLGMLAVALPEFRKFLGLPPEMSEDDKELSRMLMEALLAIPEETPTADTGAAVADVLGMTGEEP